MQRTEGFTLIEIAIVIAIMLTLLTLGLGLLNAQLSSTAYSATKQRQQAIKDALVAYLGTHRRLPCPYVPTPGAPVTGIAPSQTGTPPACPTYGVVPYATLGLSRELAEDGWGNLFSYRVYTDPAPTCPGTGRDWGNTACFGEGKSGAITLNDGTVSAPTPLANSIVAVVVSHGGNGLGAWAGQGTRNAAPTTCEEAHNAVGTLPPAGCTPVANTFYRGEREGNDDAVAYLTAADAIQAAAARGTVKLAVAQVNDDLHILYERAVGYNLMDPECDAPFPTVQDPWGVNYSVTTPGGGVQFCFYSGAGGAPSMTAPCSCSPPTTCRRLEKVVLDAYRSKVGSPPCP